MDIQVEANNQMSHVSTDEAQLLWARWMHGEISSLSGGDLLKHTKLDGFERDRKSQSCIDVHPRLISPDVKKKTMSIGSKSTHVLGSVNSRVVTWWWMSPLRAPRAPGA